MGLTERTVGMVCAGGMVRLEGSSGRKSAQAVKLHNKADSIAPPIFVTSGWYVRACVCVCVRVRGGRGVSSN